MKTAYDTLKDMWIGCYSKLTSDKKREGEAERILSFLVQERLLRKEIHSLVKSKFNLMQGKMDAVSRHITLALEIRKEYQGTNKEFEAKKGVFRAEPKKTTSKPKKNLVKNPSAKGWDQFADDE